MLKDQCCKYLCPILMSPLSVLLTIIIIIVTPIQKNRPGEKIRVAEGADIVVVEAAVITFVPC